MDKEYYRLEADSQSTDDESLGHERYQPRRPSPLHWLMHGLSVLVIFTLVIHVYFERGANTSREDKASRHYSPLWDVVKYSERVYDHVLIDMNESPSPFKGKPRPELDAAWAGIMNQSLILITEDEMKRINQPIENAYGHDGKYFAFVEVFHQLHCLNLVRKFIHRESYPDYTSFHDDPGMVDYHVDHCLDVLRQKIMCDSDIDLIVYNDRSRQKLAPEPRFDIQHTCRNFEDIRQWTLAHGVQSEL
ncbi:hypothetical protein VHEMI01504 [[Torrubiella] hemipterigena]|uniref:Tat pathway signal sequence n=1 Tax=[Torrubiella] hemipterigena TaxID=1531966 RepID=A0A0A1SM33_9HYPO|nr:hypothetical protein VHEMI01504 [[Torrubiella] hemipterigena]